MTDSAMKAAKEITELFFNFDSYGKSIFAITQDVAVIIEKHLEPSVPVSKLKDDLMTHNLRCDSTVADIRNSRAELLANDIEWRIRQAEDDAAKSPKGERK